MISNKNMIHMWIYVYQWLVIKINQWLVIKINQWLVIKIWFTCGYMYTND